MGVARDTYSSMYIRMYHPRSNRTLLYQIGIYDSPHMALIDPRNKARVKYEVHQISKFVPLPGLEPRSSAV